MYPTPFWRYSDVSNIIVAPCFNVWSRFFHDLSEGLGFVVALQATPQFTADQVAEMYNTLSEGNGLWDITADELNAMTSEISTAFGL